MDDSTRWDVPLSVDALAALEPKVDEFLARHAIDDRATYVTRLVIEEVVLNLVQHAGPGADLDQVTVEIAVLPERVSLTIEDSRPAFDPLDAPALDVDAPLAERRAGGMGLHLVRTMTDELTYERDDGRNRLRAAVNRG